MQGVVGTIKVRMRRLQFVRRRLFTIGSALASDPEKSKMKIPDLHQEDIELLEKEVSTKQSLFTNYSI